jgi:ElaB/YqjD/DUF883 family membrane-anchored ribosome-binding protein
MADKTKHLPLMILEKGKHRSTPSDRLDNQAMAMEKDLAEMNGTVRDIAQENLGQMGVKPLESGAPERDKVHGEACACEQYVSAWPLRSVLMATDVGWLLGRFGKRR